MPDENVMSSGAAGWTHSHTTDGSGDYKVIFKTENKFVDQDINVTITTPAAVGPTLAVTDNTGALTMGTASSGVYSPTATITGNAVIGTAGWITAGNHSVSDTSVVVGKVNQSTLKNGTTTIPDGSQITPSASDQTITITEGYNAARTIVVKAASASDPATVTSGQGVINTISGYTYNSEDDNFTVTGSGTVSAPTVGTAGFISSAIGTKNGNTAALSAPVDKIVITSAITGVGEYVPSISKKTPESGDGWTNAAASGSATTSKPASGVYVAVQSSANTGTITSTPSVSTAGYGDTTHYGKTTDATLVVGAKASQVTYVPIATTSATLVDNTVSWGSGWITAGSSTVAAGTVTSGSANITSASYAYNSSGGNFKVTGSASIAAPTVNTAGYISSTVGTKNSNTATLNATVAKISVKATLSSNSVLTTPVISTQTAPTGVIDAADGDATTTVPTSGVYVIVGSEQVTSTITATPGVQVAGYGTTTSGQYTVHNTPSATVGATASGTTYIPIKMSTVTKSGATVSYTQGWVEAGSQTISAATVTSGSKAAEFSAPTYNSTSGKFEITASGTIPAPTVNTAGYISSTTGTKNTGSISGTTELAKVKVGVTVPSGSQAVKPTIVRTARPDGDTWYDGASGDGVPDKPTSTTKTAYVRVDAAAVSKSISVEGKVSAAGYGTTSYFSKDTATSITAGSNAADALYVPIKTGSITSGSATISSITYTYNSSNGNFTVGGQATVSAPTIGSEGYVSADIGTKSANTNGAKVSTTVAKIGIQANLSGSGTKVPAIAKNDTNTNVVGAGTAVTTKPSSGYYIAVQSPANKGTVQATATVTSAGYGTTTSGQYTTTPSSSLTVGADASQVTYIPITQATFANTATSGTTYTDISSTAPVLISGDYLYINAGYTPAQKISLARLVPDGASDNLAANFILNGYSAYNDNGVLITGNIPTYTGIYEEV